MKNKILILFITCCLYSCYTKEEMKQNEQRTFVKEIRVLTIEGDTAIIYTGMGTTMTIEIIKK